MKIYIIGMPASGKSTFGQKLANSLKIKFIDTDWRIEESEKLSIPEIFEIYGESHFRELEQRTLHAIETENCIVSTGGGMPCFYDNLEYMKKTGKVIFLDVELEILAKRTNDQKGSRPLLKAQNHKKLIHLLTEKRNNRLQFYEQADLVLQHEEISVQKALNYLNQ